MDAFNFLFMQTHIVNYLKVLIKYSTHLKK